MKKIVVALGLLTSIIFSSTQHTYALTGTQSAGGSNYDFYQLDGCNREPYGVIDSYDKNPQLIRQQLSDMYNQGQRRLRIGIFFSNGLDTGTVMDSTGGTLSPQKMANLKSLLADVKNAGFAEVVIAMHAIGANDPTTWKSFDQTLYNQNRDLIYNLRPTIAAAGISYRIDLLNEGIPTTGQNVLLTYTQRLWSDYTAKFGKNDTLGFSVIGSEPARVARIKEVYGSNQPFMFDFHFYGNASSDEYSQFVAADNSVKAQGFGSQGWIIGETYYNDKTASQNISSAIKATGRTVFYLTQWPLTRTSQCSDVNVASPVDYTNFLNWPNNDEYLIYGNIRALWVSMGAEKSIHGRPTSSERSTPDGRARYNNFQDGGIYWTPSMGAKSIHGAIYQKWAQFSYERGVLGLPTTNELATPDGIGRYNHFEGQNGSIYWTAATGAHEVQGAIKSRWASLGWERSYLGYPTSDEFGISGGRRTDFQNGYITYSFATGQITDRRY